MVVTRNRTAVWMWTPFWYHISGAMVRSGGHEVLVSWLNQSIKAVW